MASMKPSDLDLQCFQKRINLGLAGQGLNGVFNVSGLIIVRLLVKSDSRLKQLFNRHGGPPLLIAMAQYTKGLLKQEVSTTLKTVSKGRIPCFFKDYF